MNNSATPDVIAIGELNVDILLNEIKGFPAIGKEILADTLSVNIGSSSAIFASNLSSLGTPVSFIGRLGEDIFAELVFNSLKSKEVDTEHIIISPCRNTGVTIVLNYGEDRANITYPGAMNDLNLDDIDFSFLSQAKHMHFSTCFMQPGIFNDLPLLFRRAKELGLTTSLDTQWDPAEKWDLRLDLLLPFVDIFLPNMQEFKYLTRSRTLKEAINKTKDFANIIVIKNGNKGAMAWDGKHLCQQKAFKNERIVDCIGAGDSFNAGFIMEFIKNSSLSKCLEVGALTGAINTTMAGGTGAFKNKEMIFKIARDKFNYKFPE